MIKWNFVAPDLHFILLYLLPGTIQINVFWTVNQVMKIFKTT